MPIPNWLKIQNKSGVGEISIYGEITDEKWYDTDVTPQDIRDQFAALQDVPKVNLRVNSPGGGVFAGLAIYNMIKRFSGDVYAHVDGIAASIASVIIMAAKKVIIPKNAMIFVHKPMSSAWGYATDMRKIADDLDKIELAISSIFEAKTGLGSEKIAELLANETLLTGEEAFNLKFADVLHDAKDFKASIADGVPIINGQKISEKILKSIPQDVLLRTFTNNKPADPEPVVDPEPDFSVLEGQLALNKTFI